MKTDNLGTRTHGQLKTVAQGLQAGASTELQLRLLTLLCSLSHLRFSSFWLFTDNKTVIPSL